MSIKRRQNRIGEVNFKASILRFTFFLFVVLVCGFSLNLLIGRIDLNQYIPQDRLDQSNYQVEVAPLKFQFSKGVVPLIGVFSNRIEIKDKECPSRRGVVNDVLVVLDMFSLIRGEIRPGAVKIGHLDIVTPKNCALSVEDEPAGGAAEKAVSKKIDQNFKKQMNKIVSEAFPKKLFALAKKYVDDRNLPKFNVSRFDFRFIDGYQESLMLRGQAWLSKKSNQPELELEVDELVVQGENIPLRSLQLQAKTDFSIFELNLSAFIREGRLSLQSKIQNTKGYPSFFSGQLKDAPISPFSLFLLDQTQLSYLWLSCGGEVSGEWSQVFSKRFPLGVCELTGPYGTAVVQSSKMTLTDFSEVEIEFKKIELDKLIKSKRNVYFSGVLSSYGIFSGKFSWKSGEWKLLGQLEEADFIFSRNNRREVQRVKQIPILAVGKGKSGSISVKDLELENGEFQGVISAEFQRAGLARSKVAIHKMVLTPKIYELMIASKPAPISIYGKMDIKAKEIKSWSALMTVQGITGEQYNLSALKIEGQKKEEELTTLQFTIPAGEITKELGLAKLLIPTTLEEGWSEGFEKFQEFSVKLEILGNKQLSWKRGYIRFTNKWQLSSEGELFDVDNAKAWVQWDVPGKQKIKWERVGAFWTGSWTPSEDWMKDWLDKNSNFLRNHSTINHIQPEGSELSDDVKAVGQKILDKAKSVLPLQNEPAGKKQNKDAE